MKSPFDKLRISISKTADGESDYLQIISSDQFSLNIVVIADSMEIKDTRPGAGRKPE